MFVWSKYRSFGKIAFFSIILLTTILMMVACSSEESVVDNDKTVSNEDQTSHYPITITDSADRSVTFTESPKRIVTVNPADMEIIYALGGEVVGRPQNSTDDVRPVEAEVLEDIGYPMAINFEKTAAANADLFIGHKRINLKDVPTLEALNMNVILTQGDSLEEIKGLIDMYGNILDKKEESDELINSIEKETAEILANNQDKHPKVLILFGTPTETMAALPQSLAGSLFEMAGAENISKDLPGLKRYPTYAQLSLERILEADPDAIYFMSIFEPEEALEQFQAEMSLIPAWNELSAVKNGNLIILPHELFGTNPGPRIVDSLQFLNNSLNNLEY